MSTPSAEPMGILLSANLLFASKVAGTSQALGYPMETAMRPAAAVEKLARGGVACLFVDLATPGLDWPEITAAIPDRAVLRVIGFGPHVETSWFEAARQGGCDEVLPHSQLSARLPELLQSAWRAHRESGIR